MKQLTFFLFLLIQVSPYAQLQIDAGGDAFNDIYTWGDGYVAMAQKYNGVMMSKTRWIRHYDSSGKLLWDKEIEPFSYSNTFLAHKDAGHVFMVNIGSVTPTAALETKSTENALVIYSLGKTGELKTLELNYNKYLAPFLGDGFEDVSLQYLAAYSGGLVGVLTKYDSLGVYSYFTYDGEHDPVVVKLPNTLNSDAWTNQQMSKPEYYLKDDNLLVIQLTKDISGSISINTAQYSLKNNELVSQASTILSLDSKYTYGASEQSNVEPVNENHMANHYYTIYGNNQTTIVATLGAFLEYQIHNGKLYAVGSYYTADAGKYLSTENLLGYFFFEISLAEDKKLSETEVKYIPFDKSQAKGKMAGHTVLIGDKGTVCAVNYKKGYYYFVDGQEQGRVDLSFESIKLAALYGFAQTEGLTIDLSEISNSTLTHRAGNGFVVYEKLNSNPAGYKGVKIFESN